MNIELCFPSCVAAQTHSYQKNKPIASSSPLGLHNIVKSVTASSAHGTKENHQPAEQTQVDDNAKEEIDNLWEIMNNRPAEEHSTDHCPLFDTQNSRKSR